MAKVLEREHSAVRFSPDERLVEIGANGDDEIARAAVECEQWESAKRVLRSGSSVILENGFWTRKERAAYRAEADELGAVVRPYFLDVPLEELKHRIRKRNENLPSGAFHVDLDDLDGWIKVYEPPTEEEFR